MKIVRLTALLLAALMLLCGCRKASNDTTSTVPSADGISTAPPVESTVPEQNVSKPVEDVGENNGAIVGDNVCVTTANVNPPRVDLSDYVYDNAHFELKEIYNRPNEMTIKKYTGNATKLIIPAEIDGKLIRVIDNSVFYGQTKLEAVYIEDGIEEIGNNAFSKCIALKELRFSNTLKTIGICAFNECIKLTNLYIPDSVEEINGHAFDDCMRLTKVRLPSTLKTLYSCFEGCIGLRGEAVIPKTEGKINALYYGCPGITELTVMEGGTELYATFYGMQGLEEVHIPESVLEITEIDKLFKDSTHLKTIYVVDGSYAAYKLVNSKWNVYLASEVR